MSNAVYIHGTDPDEQARLARLSADTNQALIDSPAFDAWISNIIGTSKAGAMRSPPEGSHRRAGVPVPSS